MIVLYLLVYVLDDFLGCQCDGFRRLQAINNVLIGLTCLQRAGRNISRLGEQTIRQKCCHIIESSTIILFINIEITSLGCNITM